MRLFFRGTFLSILSLIVCAVAWASSPASSDVNEQTFVVIVANNHSLDADTEPLRFADDDGAKYFEMFRAVGAKTALLAVLDPDAQQRYKEAAAAAVPPYRRNLMDRLDAFFDEIQAANDAGQKTHFVFVYSGHGNIGANREGYLNLVDSKFRRSELFRDILAKSPATFNHIVLDACHAYYMVNKKGASDKTGNYAGSVRSFLTTEELNRYPNTGVILAASSESETHEWSKWEAGIFSHELRSAMLGSADVDGDGKVTYAEAAACVEAANSAIDIPRARLKVFYQAPAVNVSLPLLNLSAYARTRTPKVVFPKEMAGRYYIEDARGVRIADFNYSAEQDLEVSLPGSGPFFVRTDTSESTIDTSQGVVLAGNLSFESRTASSKGSVERSFRKDLYSVPFGLGFFLGAQAFLAQSGAPQADIEIREDAGPNRLTRVFGWVALGTGLAAGVGSAVAYGLARSAFSDYQKTDSESQAAAYQSDAENRLLTSRVLLGVGAALTVTGGVLLVIDAVKHKKRKATENISRTPLVVIHPEQLFFGIQGRF